MLLSGSDAWTPNKQQVKSLDIPLPWSMTDFEYCAETLQRKTCNNLLPWTLF